MYQICRRFRAIIDGTASLQLAIELGAAGYRRCESKMPAGEALEAFRDIQRMYRNPQSKLYELEIDISPLDSNSLPRSFSWWNFGNVLVGSWYHTHTVNAHPPADTDIYTLWLGMGPDPFGGQQGSQRQIHRLHFDRQLQVETVDVDQDLLVLNGAPNTLHFMSLSTGDTHPKAHRAGEAPRTLDIPPMRWIVSLSGDWLLASSFHLRTDSDTGAVIVDTQTLDATLYHWPSGTCLQVSFCMSTSTFYK